MLERSVGRRSEVIEREEHIEQAACVIKAMAHPLRLKIHNRVFYRISDQRTLRLLGMMREVFCSSSH